MEQKSVFSEYEKLFSEIGKTSDVATKIKLLCSLYLLGFTNYSIKEFRYLFEVKDIREDYEHRIKSNEISKSKMIEDFLAVFDKWAKYRMLKGHITKYYREYKEDDPTMQEWLSIKDKGYEEQYKSACELFLQQYNSSTSK